MNIWERVSPITMARKKLVGHLMREDGTIHESDLEESTDWLNEQITDPKEAERINRFMRAAKVFSVPFPLKMGRETEWVRTHYCIKRGSSYKFDAQERLKQCSKSNNK